MQSLLRYIVCIVAALFAPLGAWASFFPLFNPFVPKTPQQIQLDTQLFVANDPLSLEAFTDEWQGDYHPREGANYALETMRVDLGTYLLRWGYVGYFYQKQFVVHSNRGLVDGYHALKQDITPDERTDYPLELEIEGIERHGILWANRWRLLERKTDSLEWAMGGYLSYDTDLQDGTLHGEGSLFPDGTYSSRGEADYYYYENLLYDLDVDHSYGWGYGLHVGVRYAYIPLQMSLTFIVNDLFAYTHWSHAPYSRVSLETENQTYGASGYVSYHPTIYGWEGYKSHTFKLSPTSYFNVHKVLNQEWQVEGGYESYGGVSLFYGGVHRMLGEAEASLLYEGRFHMVSFTYKSPKWHISLYTNGLKEASAVGMSLSYCYQF